MPDTVEIIQLFNYVQMYDVGTGPLPGQRCRMFSRAVPISDSRTSKRV